MTTYLIKNAEGLVINTVIADASFMATVYPDGDYEEVEIAVEPEPEQATTYKVITPTFYLEFIQDVAQMTTADFAAYETDQHPDMIYTRAMHRSISGMIDVNIPSNMNLAVKGLNFMATHGHTGQLAPEEFTATILAAWAAL